MTTKTKQWSTGTGSATIEYTGQGDGQIIITSDPNSVYEERSMQIAVETTDGSGIQKTITINQAAKQRIDLSAAVVTAATQTYSGSAKTPTPTVTLNGSTVPSSGYDVAYSNNTNAGTANITITGKGDYTGTSYGTFTINKATPSYTAPTYRNLTYSGSAQYLTTTGSTYHGTIQYSSDGVNWYSTRRQGTDAGDYTTYWRLIGDSNHTDINATSITTTIAKATPSYTAPTLRTGLTYSGSSQYLTTSGQTYDGTIQYSTNGVNWYSSRRSGTNAGTYYCYWKLVGDSNHSDIDSTYLGSTTIAKKSRSIYWSSYPSSLNVGDSDYLSAYVSEGSGDGTISFSSSNSNVASVSGSYVYGEGEGTCTIYATVSAGTNYKSASTSYTISVIALDYVDLGLPSGKLWAKGNICKSGNSYYIGEPSDYGCYFSWGNIDGHDMYDGYNWGPSPSGPYASTTGASVSSDISPSDSLHDAARACLGSPWHMPSNDDWDELYNYTDREWANVGGGMGWKFMKKTDHSVYIFLPASGEGDDTSVILIGSYCLYWSSGWVSSQRCNCLMGTSTTLYAYTDVYRHYGQPVRAVRG